MVHFDPQSDNRKCLFAKRAKIGGAGDSCESFFLKCCVFFSWPSDVTKCSSVLSQNESYCSYLYLESKGSSGGRLSISQTLGNLDLLIFLFTQNKFTFITSYFTRKQTETRGKFAKKTTLLVSKPETPLTKTRENQFFKEWIK